MKNMVFTVDDIEELFDSIGYQWTGKWENPYPIHKHLFGSEKYPLLSMKAFECGYGDYKLLSLTFAHDGVDYIKTLYFRITDTSFCQMSEDCQSDGWIPTKTFNEKWQEILLKNHPHEMTSRLIELKKCEIEFLEKQKTDAMKKVEEERTVLEKLEKNLGCILSRYDAEISKCQEEIVNLEQKVVANKVQIEETSVETDEEICKG